MFWPIWKRGGGILNYGKTLSRTYTYWKPQRYHPEGHRSIKRGRFDLGRGYPYKWKALKAFRHHNTHEFQTRLKLLAEETRTMIFYESPHKLLKTLNQFVDCFGKERRISVSRELSKLHEETIRGTVVEVLKHFEAKPPKGELVIVVEGKG